jgi:hypothetical protein
MEVAPNRDNDQVDEIDGFLATGANEGIYMPPLDTDQRDLKGVWPNLSRRSNEQQDNYKRIEFETDQIKPS